MNSIDIKNNSVVVKCEMCDGEVFKEAIFLRKISKLLIGTPSDSILPIKTFQCVDCNHINKELIPELTIKTN